MLEAQGHECVWSGVDDHEMVQKDNWLHRVLWKGHRWQETVGCKKQNMRWHMTTKHPDGLTDRWTDWTGMIQNCAPPSHTHTQTWKILKNAIVHKNPANIDLFHKSSPFLLLSLYFSCRGCQRMLWHLHHVIPPFLLLERESETQIIASVWNSKWPASNLSPMSSLGKWKTKAKTLIPEWSGIFYAGIMKNSTLQRRSNATVTIDHRPMKD